MIATILAYITVYSPAVIVLGFIIYLIVKWFRNHRKPVDAPSPLKSVKVETPSDQLANIIYYCYIRYAQNIFWYQKQWEWDFRKMTDYLKPQTKNRYADQAIYKVLKECREIDRVRRNKINDEIKRFPQRYRSRRPQPPWVSIAAGDVRLAVDAVLTQQCVERILAMKKDLDIPPQAGSGPYNV